MAEVRTQASGWRIFAAVVVTLVGFLNLFQGLAAMLADQVTYVDAGDLLIVDTTGWGIVAFIFGVLLIFAGYGLTTGSRVARGFVVTLVALHALAQFATLAAYPVWSVAMITMDVLIIYGLTVHWNDRDRTTSAREFDYLRQDNDIVVNGRREKVGAK